MVVVAFFYLLRVGEYTASRRCQPKRTIPLQKCDVRLWRKGQLLDHESMLPTLLSADSAIISIANTKNGTKGAVVHHDAFGGNICPGLYTAEHSVPPAHSDNPDLRSGCDDCSPMGRHVRLSHGQRVYSRQGIVAQPPCWRCNGNETQRRHGQHDHVNRTVDVPNIPHLHTLPKWGAIGRSKQFTFQNVG